MKLMHPKSCGVGGGRREASGIRLSKSSFAKRGRGGTATSGSLQALIRGVPILGREKWCCKNGVGASQATGESFFKQNLGMKVKS